MATDNKGFKGKYRPYSNALGAPIVHFMCVESRATVFIEHFIQNRELLDG
jgi:hypothetical protein